MGGKKIRKFTSCMCFTREKKNQIDMTNILLCENVKLHPGLKAEANK